MISAYRKSSLQYHVAKEKVHCRSEQVQWMNNVHMNMKVKVQIILLFLVNSTDYILSVFIITVCSVTVNTECLWSYSSTLTTPWK